jgi:peroxiredoxin
LKKSLFLLLISSVQAVASGQQKKAGYVLAGNIYWYADSTLLYLDEISGTTTRRLDSTYIVRNEFRFSGSLPEDAVQVMLRVANTTDFKFFWLENSTIRFVAEKGNLAGAKITGSQTQDEYNQLDAAIKRGGEEREQDSLFIVNHPNSALSATLLWINCLAWGKATTTRLYIGLPEKLRYSANGREILEFIRFNKNIRTGDRYADFEQPDARGRMARLSDFRDKVILLEFWASWSRSCREENPELVKIYNEFKEKGFEIFGVAADNQKDAWLKAIQHDSLTWTNVTDLNGERNKAMLIYGVYRYPTNYLIDRSGTIVAMDLQGDALRDKLQDLLK